MRVGLDESVQIPNSISSNSSASSIRYNQRQNSAFYIKEGAKLSDLGLLGGKLRGVGIAPHPYSLGLKLILCGEGAAFGREQLLVDSDVLF
jgi:hypothetical protein